MLRLRGLGGLRLAAEAAEELADAATCEVGEERLRDVEGKFRGGENRADFAGGTEHPAGGLLDKDRFFPRGELGEDEAENRRTAEPSGLVALEALLRLRGKVEAVAQRLARRREARARGGEVGFDCLFVVVCSSSHS